MVDHGRDESGLAAYILQNADALRLTPDEVAALNARYWLWQGGAAPGDALATIEAILGRGKAHAAILDYERDNEVGIAELIRAHVDRVVDASIDRKIQSVSIVERELADAVLERLIAWAKLYATFVSVPLSLLLIIFALFGYTTFSDVRGAKDKVDAIIAQSKQQIQTSQRQIARSNQQLSGNRSRMAEAEIQIAQAQRDLDAIKKQLDGRGAQFANLNSSASRNVQLAQQQLDQLKQKLRALGQASAATDQRLNQVIGDVFVIKAKIGGFSASAESSSAEPGIIHQALPGRATKEYGPWGLTEASLDRFIATSGYAAQFAGKKPPSEAFDTQWKALAASDHDDFFEAQRAFVYNGYFVPLAKFIRDKSDLDVLTRSNALQEVVMQIAVSEGIRSVAVTRAIEKLTAAGQWNPKAPDFDRTLIAAIYDARIAFFQARFPPFVNSSMALKAKALALYDKEKAGK